MKFRRQHPIGPYVADFYCAAAKLVVEVDGAVHESTQCRDRKRDDFLRSLGLTVTRVAAKDILSDVETVADGLIRLCGPSTIPPGTDPG